jgi:hypothetical protein
MYKNKMVLKLGKDNGLWMDSGGGSRLMGGFDIGCDES